MAVHSAEEGGPLGGDGVGTAAWLTIRGTEEGQEQKVELELQGLSGGVLSGRHRLVLDFL